MSWITITLVIILFICFAIVFVMADAKSAPTIKQNIFYKREKIFSKTEIQFLAILEQIIVNPDLKIFGQVAIEEIITVDYSKTKEFKNRQIARNKINRRRFDYVIVNKNDYSTVCVIELNDKSHNQPKRQQRDEALRAICKDVNLPLIEITAAMQYDTGAVMRKMPFSVSKIFLDDTKN